MYRHACVKCVLLVLLCVCVCLCVGVRGSLNVHIWNDTNFGFPQNFTISQNKRTKSSKNADEIQKSDTHTQDTKTGVFSESYHPDPHTHYTHTHSHTQYTQTSPKQGELDKYEKYDKYGYKSNKNTHTHTSKSPKKEECKSTKPPEYKCAAFVIILGGHQRASIYQSINGGPLQLGAIYQPDNVVAAHIVSNNKRGSVSEYDLSVGYVYENRTLTIAKFRYDGEQANLLYETIVGRTTSYDWPFVSDMSIPKGSCEIDTYNVYDIENQAAQYNLNSKTGAIISTYLQQGMCTHTIYFKDKTSRWLCFGPNPAITAYLRDPSTNTNFIPPVQNNPVPKFNIIAQFSPGSYCGEQYITMLTSYVDLSVFKQLDSDARRQWYMVDIQISRARISQNSPYFEEARMVYTANVVVAERASVFSPPQTDIIYACMGSNFWRFDGAFAADVPIRPTVQNPEAPDCEGIVSFTDAPNEVYTNARGALYHSRNAGRSFARVEGPMSDWEWEDVRRLAATGFVVPN